MRFSKLFLSILLVTLGVSASFASVDRAIKLTVKTEQGEVLPLYSNSYALVIGASNYSAGWPKLPGVKKDVAAVRDALQQKGFGVTAILDPNRSELISAIETFINRYGGEVNNRLMIYFAGHGHTVKFSYGEEMGFIVPVDAPTPSRSESSFIAKSLDMQQIEVFAKRIQAKHAMFVFDSCFSGSIFALSRAVPESINYKTAMPVRQFITSGSAEEKVPDESIFRRQFISGIEGEADVNGDGYITGTEFGEFLQSSVVNYSKGSQHPQYGKIRNPNLDKGDFVFLNPARQVPIFSSGDKTSTGASQNIELAYWNSIKDSGNSAMYQAYMTKYPSGDFVELAKLKIDALGKAGTKTAVNKTQDDERTYWESIRDSNNAKLYQAYLLKFPQGAFVDLARIKMNAASSHSESNKTQVGTVTRQQQPKRKEFKAAIFQVHTVRDELGGKAYLKAIQGALRALYAEPKIRLTHSYYRLKNADRVETIKKSDVDLFVWAKASLRAQVEPDIDYVIRYGRKLGVDMALLYEVDAKAGGSRVDCYLVDVRTGQIRLKTVKVSDYKNKSIASVSQRTAEMLTELINSPRTTTKVYADEQRNIKSANEMKDQRQLNPARQPVSDVKYLRQVQDAIQRHSPPPPPPRGVPANRR